MPILTITGQYDGDQPGALAHYREHLANASAAARAQHYLVIGPWDHAGTRTPKAEVAGLTFGKASVIDMNQLHKDWYDWTLKNGKKPVFLGDRVVYYVLGSGAEEWRYAPALEAVTAQARPLYLDSRNGAANELFASGSMVAAAPAAAAPDRYVYDPLDVSSAAVDAVEVANGLTDQRWVLQQSGRYLVYHSAVFDKATDLAGFFRLSAWMSLDQPDTDFHVAVFEIQPDGTNVFLSDDLMRARYRGGRGATCGNG